jgi:hypothetical protein
MGNCLKTQLKSVVDNDNLEVFGGTKFTVFQDAANKQVLWLNVTENTKVTCKNAVLSYSESGVGSKELDVNYGNNPNKIYVLGTAEPQNIVVHNKYVINEFYIMYGLDSNVDITYLDQLKKVTCYSSKGNGTIYGKVSNTIQYLQSYYKGKLEFSGIYNSLTDLILTKPTDFNYTTVEMASLFPVLTQLYITSNEVTGNFDALGNIKTLASISGIKSIGGTVEGFVAAKVHNGVASGSVNYAWPSLNIFFKDNQRLTNTGTNSIVWAVSGDNTSITLNGGEATVIHVNNDGSWTRIS